MATRLLGRGRLGPLLATIAVCLTATLGCARPAAAPPTTSGVATPVARPTIAPVAASATPSIPPPTAASSAPTVAPAAGGTIATAPPAPAIAAPAAGAPTAPTASCAPGVDLLGFSDALDKGRFADTDVGGLSALAYDPAGDVYLALVDNERETPARVYTLRLPIEGVTLGTPRVTAVTGPRDAADRPFTGRTLDGEGLARTTTGDLLVASETEPSVRRFSPDGRLLAELPIPARFLVAPRGEATGNETIEGLALGPDGRTLYAAMEGPLAPDGRTDDGRARLRLLRYEDRPPGGFAPAGQFFYLAEPGQGVSDLAAIGDGDLLVLERGFAPGAGNTVRLFRVALAGARDVADQASLAAPGLTALAKRLVVDLARCPARGARHPAPQPNPLLDNDEALALGPTLPDGRRTLLVISDDNFSPIQVTRVLALALRP